MPKPKLTGACHCGAVRLVLPRRPRSLTSCNCSICRRYGTLWAYYKASTVRVEHAAGATAHYQWGERRLRFVRCARCGCVTHWEETRRTPASRVGVNARLIEPEVLGDVRIRHLDGARTWKYLD
ncbi:MAG TPA: GFA family protein [Myxococcaceae bacterium]|nr:GFA family protein [Myxococcaceae bacterium]